MRSSKTAGATRMRCARSAGRHAAKSPRPGAPPWSLLTPPPPPPGNKLPRGQAARPGAPGRAGRGALTRDASPVSRPAQPAPRTLAHGVPAAAPARAARTPGTPGKGGDTTAARPRARAPGRGGRFFNHLPWAGALRAAAVPGHYGWAGAARPPARVRPPLSQPRAGQTLLAYSGSGGGGQVEPLQVGGPGPV